MSRQTISSATANELKGQQSSFPSAYCAQRTRSTWDGLIGHVLTNGIGMPGILWFIIS